MAFMACSVASSVQGKGVFVPRFPSPPLIRESDLPRRVAVARGRASSRRWHALLHLATSGQRGATPELRLRQKIEADPKRPRHIITVFGVGYRFER